MKNGVVVAVVVALVGVFVLLCIRSLRLSGEQERHAIKACHDLDGETILRYSYNSDSFYLEGCKLR